MAVPAKFSGFVTYVGEDGNLLYVAGPHAVLLPEESSNPNAPYNWDDYTPGIWTVSGIEKGFKSNDTPSAGELNVQSMTNAPYSIADMPRLVVKIGKQLIALYPGAVFWGNNLTMNEAVSEGDGVMYTGGWFGGAGHFVYVAEVLDDEGKKVVLAVGGIYYGGAGGA